jgi:hypothetical protein
VVEKDELEESELLGELELSSSSSSVSSLSWIFAIRSACRR